MYTPDEPLPVDRSQWGIGTLWFIFLCIVIPLSRRIIIIGHAGDEKKSDYNLSIGIFWHGFPLALVSTACTLGARIGKLSTQHVLSTIALVKKSAARAKWNMRIQFIAPRFFLHKVCTRPFASRSVKYPSCFLPTDESLFRARKYVDLFPSKNWTEVVFWSSGMADFVLSILCQVD